MVVVVAAVAVVVVFPIPSFFPFRRSIFFPRRYFSFFLSFFLSSFFFFRCFFSPLFLYIGCFYRQLDFFLRAFFVRRYFCPPSIYSAVVVVSPAGRFFRARRGG
ncbi:MAG: hypothetical protein LBO05_01380 [Deltaproteobacteria bacterium]|nr:hypothetical protein [Deltaproteobacteria bacterium]